MKILDEVKNIIRVKHYSRHTESCYCDWIKHFILFHKLQSRNDLFNQPEQKIGSFLTHLAVNKRVAASTQNQARSIVSIIIQKYDRPRHQYYFSYAKKHNKNIAP